MSLSRWEKDSSRNVWPVGRSMKSLISRDQLPGSYKFTRPARDPWLWARENVETRSWLSLFSTSWGLRSSAPSRAVAICSP